MLPRQATFQCAQTGRHGIRFNNLSVGCSLLSLFVLEEHWCIESNMNLTTMLLSTVLALDLTLPWPNSRGFESSDGYLIVVAGFSVCYEISVSGLHYQLCRGDPVATRS